MRAVALAPLHCQFKEEKHMLSTRVSRKLLITAGASLAVVGLLAGCTSGTPETGSTNEESTVEGNEATGDTITIGFSGPAADHGWLGAINSAAIAEAAKYSDIKLVVA